MDTPIDLSEFILSEQPKSPLTRDGAVVFVASSIDACALWRMFMPHLNFPGSKFYHFEAKTRYEAIAGNDVIVVQRCSTQAQYEFLRAMRAMDIRIVYDLDDNVWEIPETNPAHHILYNHREGFKHCIRMVDVVSVSTKTLAKAVKDHVKDLKNVRTGHQIPILVAENWIDERLFAVPKKRPQFIVGWAGSSSHMGDLLLIVDAIKEQAPEHPEVIFEFRGLEAPPELRKLPNITHKLWTPVAEFGVRLPLWGWSIALAPVTNEAFNDSKSSIKMIEAAYCGIPCLASWQRPYDEFCSHDKELKWLLCAGKTNWAPKLKELINDQARRDELGRRAYKVAKEYYSYSKPHEGWKKVIEAARAV